MEIQFKVNQREALRLGYDTPGPVVFLNVDPAMLEKDERELLAQLVGHENRCETRCIDGTYVDISLIVADMGGLRAALRREIETLQEKREQREAAIEAERQSYRVMIHALENHEYFEPNEIPPKSRDLGVEWIHSPNYSKNDPEALALWDRFKKLRAAEHEREIRAWDRALDMEDLESAQALVAAAEKTASETCPRAVALIERVKIEQLEREQLEAAKQHDTMRAVLAEYATPDVVERFDVGLLPGDELEGVIKSVLFRDMARTFVMFSEITESDIEHDDGCFEHEPKFTSRSADYLDADQWAALKAIRGGAPKGAVVEARIHRGWCDSHPCRDMPVVERAAAKVTLEFLGQKYSERYALD